MKSTTVICAADTSIVPGLSAHEIDVRRDKTVDQIKSTSLVAAECNIASHHESTRCIIDESLEVIFVLSIQMVLRNVKVGS